MAAEGDSDDTRADAPGPLAPADEAAARAGWTGGRAVTRSQEGRHAAVGTRDLRRWPSRLGQRLVAATHAVVRSRVGVAVSGLLGPYTVLVMTLVTGLVVTSLLTAVAAEIYEAVVERDGLAALDQPVLDAMVRIRTPDADRAITLFTNLGGPVEMPVVALVAAVGLALLWRSRTPVVLLVGAAAGSLLMTVAGKALVGRTRPPLALAVPPYETSPSFPSGHSLNAVVVAGVVAYLLVLHLTSARARGWAVALSALFAGAMGLSRVYLGHHWLTDVVVAWVLGLAWLAVVITAHRLWLTVRQPARAPAASA